MPLCSVWSRRMLCCRFRLVGFHLASSRRSVSCQSSTVLSCRCGAVKRCRSVVVAFGLAAQSRFVFISSCRRVLPCEISLCRSVLALTGEYKVLPLGSVLYLSDSGFVVPLGVVVVSVMLCRCVQSRVKWSRDAVPSGPGMSNRVMPLCDVKCHWVL